MKHISHYICEVLDFWDRGRPPQKKRPRANEAQLLTTHNKKSNLMKTKNQQIVSKQEAMSLFDKGILSVSAINDLFRANPEWRDA